MKHTQLSILLMALVALTVGCTQEQASEKQKAASASTGSDTIYHNGIIITINDQQPEAEAVAVKDGKILAVGSEV